MTAVLIFIATLLLVITQPRGLGIGWSAAAGAIASLLLGTVTLSDIPTVWSIVWNASGTLIGLIIITLVLDEAGVLPVVRAEGRSGFRGKRREAFHSHYSARRCHVRVSRE